MIETRGLSFVIAKSAQSSRFLIENTSVSLPPGTFTAIVGPSGCGKSTFLKILSGIIPASSGCVALGGSAPAALKAQFPLAIGYLPQFSAFHTETTVLEALETALALRLGKISSKQSRDWLARVVNLTGIDGVMNQKISTLSGGQLRRLALAEELLGDPAFLFLDELTSGLDPHSERELMHWLADLAKQSGKNIVIVTHAIANLHVCDQVVLLNQGQVLYAGPPDRMLGYFGQSALEDIYQYAGSYGPMDVSALEQQPLSPPVPIKSARPASSLKQFWTLSMRQMSLLWRDKGQLWLQLILMISFPLLVAVFALKGLPEVKRLSLQVQTNVVENLAERLQYLTESFQVSSLVGGLSMFQVILLTLMGANNAAREIAKERQVLTKELRAGLSPPAYLLTKVGQVFGFSLLQAALMAGFVKVMCGFPGEMAEQFFILFMATFAMSCTCLFFSAISNTPERASLLSIYLVGLQLPLSGAVLALPEWLKWITRPFITGYWGWSGYLRTFENFRHFDIVKQVSKTDIASYRLSIIVLSLHVIVTLSAALIVIYRKRNHPPT